MCKFISLSLCMLCFALLLTAQTVNVKDLGAKGDGTTDDYKALLSAVNTINKNAGGTLLFPPGTYYIGVYHTKDNKLSDLQFNNCKNLTIKGDKAKIKVNGNFRRTIDYTVGGGRHSYSNTNTIIPFWLTNCSKVVIQDLEIDGGVAQMTKDNGVGEYGGHLIRIISCSDITLKNLHLHHAQTDGVDIGGKDTPTSNLRMDHVIAENNARQGMSIASLVGGVITNCTFRLSGITGKYGSHAPSAGVDIEPQKLTGGQGTGDIRFSNCIFSDNMGGQFLCSSPAFTNNVTLVHCTIKAGGSQSKFPMVLSARKVLIDSCEIDCGNGSIYPRWQKAFGSDAEIRNCTIKSAGSGIIAITDTDQDYVSVHNNKIICTSTGPIRSYFPYLRMKNLTFTDNEILLNSNSINKPGVTSVIENGKSFSGNKFRTERGSMLLQRVSTKGMQKVSN